MSDPRNPVDQYDTYKTVAILAAFKYTDAAEETTLPLDIKLDRGDPVGEGIVILNDARPTATDLVRFQHTYEWNSLDVNHTFSAGEMLVSDRNAVSLISFIRSSVIEEFNTSLENLTFSLRLFWILDKNDTDDTEVIKSSHFIFSIPEIRHSSDGTHNYYSMPMLSLYNMKCQLPNYSNLYNMTITHEDGNLAEKTPTPNPGGGSIKPRGEEDGSKLSPRKERMDLSKPMITLEDVTNGIKADLEARNDMHKGQLQAWQSIIRDDFSDKINRSPEQVKDVPIKYNFSLGSEYPEYIIDNRNLPFEQPEQNQTKAGIRSIPTRTGETLSRLISRVMNMSKRVGEDAGEGFTYKIATPWRRLKSNIINYDIVIDKIENPTNQKGGKDTGPGESAVDSGLTFYYKLDNNWDVIGLYGRTSRNDILTVIEANAETEDGRVSFGGDRETMAVEREQEVTEFFRVGFSGPTALHNEKRVMGVEYPKEFAQATRMKLRSQTMQDSEMTITINGNPELYSDLLRNPSDVANSSLGSPAPSHYQFIEKYPIYARLIIRNTSSNNTEDDLEPEQENKIPDKYHHEDTYMHIHRIDTIMERGKFLQKLHMLRRDDVV